MKFYCISPDDYLDFVVLVFLFDAHDPKNQSELIKVFDDVKKKKNYHKEIPDRTWGTMVPLHLWLN